MSGHCADCGTRLERAGCPNCSDEAFTYTEEQKNRWAEKDSRSYAFSAVASSAETGTED